jgi:hypothetical protein
VSRNLGFGLITIKYADFTPGQADAPPVIACAESTNVIGKFVLLISLCDGIVPDPLVITPLKPVGNGDMLVHGILTPAVGDVIVTVLVVSPEHIV